MPSAILIFDLAFEKLGLRELLARCVSTNLTVHSLVKKCGFRQTETKFAGQVIGGQPVDMVHFVLKAGDWHKSRKRMMPLAQFAEAKIREWEKHSHERKTTVGVQPDEPIFYGSKTM